VRKAISLDDGPRKQRLRSLLAAFSEGNFLVLEFDGAYFSLEWKEVYSIVKRV
jgi:hypothetical protein